MIDTDYPLAEAMYQVREMRARNADVFVWPSIEWDILYCHEELSELARVIQTQNAPDHARNSTDNGLTSEERLHLEAGQVLMMVLTTCIELGVQPDRALRLALDKVERTSARKRAEARPVYEANT